MKYIILAIFALQSAALYGQWNVVYQNDEVGNKLIGDINHLKNAIRKGYPIRVGWGFKHPTQEGVSVEHVADAKFLTILGEKEVCAQIDPIYGQRPDFEKDIINYRSNFWIMIANTNGQAKTAIRSFQTGQLADEKVQNFKFTWYVAAPLEALKDPADLTIY